MSKRAKHNIGPILIRLERERRRETTDRQTAAAIGLRPGTYSVLKSGKGSPTFEQLARCCRYFDVPLMTFFPNDLDVFVREKNGLRWCTRTGLRSQKLRSIRDITEDALRGLSPREIAQRAAGHPPDSVPVKRMEPTISTTVRAGLSLGLVDLAVSPDASDVQDAALADDLARALSNHARPPRPMVVHVVRNVIHPDFRRDPIAPFLIARAAHGLVARFLDEHPPAHTLGIAGGLHLAAFVRTIGPDSSPFPDGDDRTFVVVPLTLEPFHDHRFELADALAGDLHARAATLLGPLRVRAPSLEPFGYLENNGIGELETQSIQMVRQEYHALDVAIFGCGDRSDDGWIEWTKKILRLRFVSPPSTDVCLNMIDENGDPIPLDEHGVRREYLGAGIDEIQRVAAGQERLALLLASGESKGKSIALVVSAGCANAVVCDQAAARAVLAELEAGPSG